MSDPGKTALGGEIEKVSNWLEITITEDHDGMKAVASGMMVKIFDEQGTKFFGMDTGKGGFQVHRGDKVKIFNGEIKFIPE